MAGIPKSSLWPFVVLQMWNSTIIFQKIIIIIFINFTVKLKLLKFALVLLSSSRTVFNSTCHPTSSSKKSNPYRIPNTITSLISYSELCSSHSQVKFCRYIIGAFNLILFLIGLCFQISVAIAVVVPQLDLLISFVGAVFFSTLGLLIPAIVEIVHCWNGNLGRFYWRLIKDILIGLFSIVALVSGAYQSLNQMINGEDS